MNRSIHSMFPSVAKGDTKQQPHCSKTVALQTISSSSETISYTLRLQKLVSRRSLNRSSRSPPLFDCQRSPRLHPLPARQSRPGACILRSGPVTIAGPGAEGQGRPWHRPIVPRSCPRSIVGAGAFHDRVREGNGWDHPARATRTTTPLTSTSSQQQ
jgi:hypothetical protein